MRFADAVPLFQAVPSTASPRAPSTSATRHSPMTGSMPAGAPPTVSPSKVNTMPADFGLVASMTAASIASDGLEAGGGDGLGGGGGFDSGARSRHATTNPKAMIQRMVMDVSSNESA